MRRKLLMKYILLSSNSLFRNIHKLKTYKKKMLITTLHLCKIIVFKGFFFLILFLIYLYTYT